ncbi:uncharacterized protein LOC104898271 isoform X2 [Beta vulgaris subsp. vulgaris]|uniref:uncharacterized protein LOC104898271 isoform X2 n=1 Tax=Beta vulgaris subsp. vulgaris TaxID=3555 RepID=UPI0020372EF8|nr:uncharacterized protein LOC104898271 isoform X2 [Beta vulgaris subsp. vulgaris]
MGNSQSSSTDPRFASASRAFTQHGLQELKSQFLSLATQSQSNDQFISPSVFKFDRSDLQAVLAAILDDLFPPKDDSGVRSSECIIDAILNAATFSKDDGGGDTNSMSFEDFKDFCHHIPSFGKYLGSLLLPPDPGRTGSQVPSLLLSKSYDSNLILREEYAWLIGGLLTQLELVEWKLLYHSSYHGQSFNTFLGNVSVDEGPTLLIIKDTDGYIYGGYASQPWQKHSDFYGDLKCFLFQLHPKVSIFRPSGANNNLQWCAVNYSSESIPNGIGFGGRVNHFGLFLTANFDAGQTFECTTFGSPGLSKSNRITPEVIECWSVFPKEVQEKGSNALKGTVLDRFKEDRNMLNLVGLANSSQ